MLYYNRGLFLYRNPLRSTSSRIVGLSDRIRKGQTCLYQRRLLWSLPRRASESNSKPLQTSWIKPSLFATILLGSVAVAFPPNVSIVSRLRYQSNEGQSLAGSNRTESVVAQDSKAWNGLELLRGSMPLKSISDTISTWNWPASLDYSVMQERISALLLEIGLGPGSLYSEIVNELPDPEIYPEIDWDAEVRLGDELCLSERAFLSERRRAMRVSFAKLMGVREKDVDERDMPIVAIAGSGGGFRAMLNTVGSLVGAHSVGLLECTTYAAGVSGSCWALSVMYSGVAGSHHPQDAANHIKDRIKTSYLDLATLDELVNTPTNKYLLSGILRKAAGPTGTAYLVDVYGTLLSSRLFVPSDLRKLDQHQLSLHLLRRGVDTGQLPLPIFTAIQPVAPFETFHSLRSVREQRAVSLDLSRDAALSQEQLQIENQVRHLWYEFTPFEVGCDEIGAWIPSWALGRQFRHGRNIDRRPELGFTILTGIFGSAFCASLKLYFKEVQPTLKLLPSQLYKWLEDIVTENERDLGLIHPVLPNQLPNFLRGLQGQLRQDSPADITEQEYISFMDAGAELNIPYYPLLRRNVDCIIALDASADSQDLWFTRAEELAVRRGLRTWPRGTGWPAQVRVTSASEKGLPTFPQTDEDPANLELAERQEEELGGQAAREAVLGERDRGQRCEESGAYSSKTCEVWIGSSQSNGVDSSRLDDLDEEMLLQRDGIGVVYIPLAPNERKIADFDPLTISTWRTEMAPQESQALLDIAEANFVDSTEKIIRLLRAIWLRKKREREEREWKHRLGSFHKNFTKTFH